MSGPSVNDKMKNSSNDIDLSRLRSDLLADVSKLKNNNINRGDWVDALNQREWASGELGVDNDPKYGALAGEVLHKNEHYRESSWLAHHNSREFVMGDHDKIIIGYKITSWWNDSTNGWFKFHYGDVLESEIKIEISSQKSRGCDWEIDIWMVPKKDYEKKQ